MAIQLDSQSYGLTDNMTITWSIPNVSVNNPMGIWIFETDATYNPTSPPLYTSNKWPLVYNANPLLTRYTVNLGQLLKSYPDGVLLSEGPFFTVLVFDDIGNLLAALPTTFSISTSNLSLGKVLTGGNYATTDIDMINNAIVSSGSTLQLGDSNTPSVTLNAPITPNYAYPIASGKLGYTATSLLPNNLFISNSGQNTPISTLTIGTAGVYIINYSFRFGQGSGTTTLSFLQSWFNFSNQGNYIQYGDTSVFYDPPVVMNILVSKSGSAVITVTNTTTITFNCFINYTGSAPFIDKVYSYYSYTRIA